MSTLALALAAAWPCVGEVRPVVVEADASGGDLAVRFGLSDMAGLLALAAGARPGGDGAALDGCVQQAAGDVRVVVGPTGAVQAAPCVAEIAACPSVLRGGRSTGAVLLDLGQLGGVASRELARASDRLVLVARGGMDALAHVAARPEWLDGVWWELVVVGECRYAASEIAKALRVDEGRIHRVPWDPSAGAALGGERRLGERRWRRSPLAHSASRLARYLSGADDSRERAGLVGELAQLVPRVVPHPALGPAGEGGSR
ncbi:hypothetical protein [Streptomyces sp. NBC_01431]|uniref:hypothetical protein n=1 Tax=Streptomyces sp. NBC_01431 TaxID=2903863 RepID=UPI002E34FE59|nr:hypothetical protein [Streptomyces sp. NBC_01431]